MKRYKTVDDYINNNALWPDELRQLRDVLLSTGLTEEFKWGAPCYTHDGKNITKDLRQWRMTSAKDIKLSVIKRYVKEATKL